MKKRKDLLNAYLDGLKNGFSSVCLRSLQVRQLTPPMERPTALDISKIQQTSSTSSKNTNKITCKRTETLWAPKWQQLLQISSWLKSKYKSQTKALINRTFGDLNSLLLTNRYVVNRFIEQANKHHLTIKFKAEISVSEATSFPLFVRVKDSTSSDS